VAGVEGWRGPLPAFEALAQVEEGLARVASADLAGVAQLVAVVVADQQGAEADARTLRVGEAGDDELLPAEALDLHPRRAAARDVAAGGQLADDPLVAAPAGLAEPGLALPRLGLGPADAVGPADGLVQLALALRQRLAGQV